VLGGSHTGRRWLLARREQFRNTLLQVLLRVHKSVGKHGYSAEDISHAVDMALYEGVLDEDNDPPKLLIIGPTGAGNLLELIGGELADEVLLIWHADRCRRAYLELLPKTGGGV
jgi:hypothetical protein